MMILFIGRIIFPNYFSRYVIFRGRFFISQIDQCFQIDPNCRAHREVLIVHIPATEASLSTDCQSFIHAFI